MLQYSTMDTEVESDETIDELSLQKKTTEHLLNLGKYLQQSCPPASRFYMSSLERKVSDLSDKLKNKTEKFYCHHCGSIWSMESSIIRVQARPHRNRHIKFLQRLEASEPWKLNNKQKQKLKKFYESTNKIVFKCKACKKVTSYPGSKSWSNSRLEYTSTSTPVSKIKLKKKDLNAGLFIPSPSSCSLNSTVRTDLEDSIATETSVTVSETSSINKSTNENQNESFSLSKTSKELSMLSQSTNNSFKGQTSPNCPPKNSTSSEKQPNSKKKQTLLAQILKQGSTKKKNSSLKSFLVSL